MRYGYDEILSIMKDKYFEQRGIDADEESDSGIMLKLLTKELYALDCNLDYIRNAMFVSTAHGEALDLHARQRGLERRYGSKAVGTVLIRVDSPLEYDVVIPQGTVFTTADGTLYYVSTAQAVIYSGTGSTLAELEARSSGSRYNVDADEVTTVVTYFSSGIRVSNSSAFTGGSDDETDEELRERICASFLDLSSGMNRAYYKKLAESVDGVYSAALSEQLAGDRVLNVYVSGKGMTAPSSAVNRAQELLDENGIPGLEIRAFPAGTLSVNVSAGITLTGSRPLSTVKPAVEQAIRDYFSSLRVGEPLITARLGAAIIAVEGVQNYTLSDMADRAAVESQLYVLGSLSVERSV